jgi:multiple sugar transport system ATP-binding protein
MGSLQLFDLRKKYGAIETLKGINLSLDAGEFLVLLGPSGCGKSTILNIIAGLIEPTLGDVRIDGKSVLKVHPKNRNVAMVFQSYALYPNLSVARNIGFGLEMRGVPKAERDVATARVAETLQITDLLQRRPSELSGGQRQRVAIGRALVRDPAIFLFDEPLSNLDAKLRTEMRTEIKRLHQTLGTTVVYVTHDQIEAMTLATRIAVMKNGVIEQLGTPEEVYTHPASLFVAGFVGSPGMNLLSGKIKDEKIQLDGADISIPIPRGFLKSRIKTDQNIIVGIRPESVRIAKGKELGAFLAKVDVVELTGPEKLVVASAGNQKFLASVAPQVHLGHGVIESFVFEPGAIRLFDPVSGLAIR